jgi:hypothetical protein
VRFTVRRMMVVVALGAIALGAYDTGCCWFSHRQRCVKMIAMHEWASDTFRSRMRNNAPAFYPTEADRRWANRRAEYHERMALRWTRAAAHPWLPVEPDPPEP